VSKKYYLDTSIRLDLFEERDEPGLPKSILAERLITKIIAEEGAIIYSMAVLDELSAIGYPRQELNLMFRPFRRILTFAECNKNTFGKAKDLAAKRDVPLFDAIHALIARENRTVLVTRDAHFNKLKDIVIVKKPEEIS